MKASLVSIVAMLATPTLAQTSYERAYKDWTACVDAHAEEMSIEYDYAPDVIVAGAFGVCYEELQSVIAQSGYTQTSDELEASALGAMTKRVEAYRERRR